MSVKFWLKITAIAEKNVTEIIGVTSLSYPVQSLLAICRKGNWRVHVENHAVYISNTISTLCVALAKAGADLGFGKGGCPIHQKGAPRRKAC